MLPKSGDHIIVNCKYNNVNIKYTGICIGIKGRMMNKKIILFCNNYSKKFYISFFAHHPDIDFQITKTINKIKKSKLYHIFKKQIVQR